MQTATHTDLTISPARAVLKPARQSQYNRSEIMKDAWKIRRDEQASAERWDAALAREVAARPDADPARIKASFIQYDGKRPVISTWAECMRCAWGTAKRVADPIARKTASDNIIAGVASFGND